MHAGKLKHRQQVLVRFKVAEATLSSDVKGPREQASVCKGQTATRDTITFTCPFWTHALPNYLAWSAKGTKALWKVTVFLFQATKDRVLLLLVFLSVLFSFQFHFLLEGNHWM